MERDEGLSRLAAKDEPEKTARTMQPTYMSRPERELVDSGAYSWVADIRSRASVAKGLARNESEFRSILDMLGVTVADNSPKATNRDWIYSLADDPERKVTSGRLGYLYSRCSLENGFENKAAYHPDAASSRTILEAAKDAAVLKFRRVLGGWIAHGAPRFPPLRSSCRNGNRLVNGSGTDSDSAILRRGLRSGFSPCATPMSLMRTSKGSSPWSWRSSAGSARRRRPEGAQSARKGPATISSGCLGANPGPRLGGASASGRTRACRRGEGPQARCMGDQGDQRQFDEKGIYYFHQKGGTL